MAKQPQAPKERPKKCNKCTNGEIVKKDPKTGETYISDCPACGGTGVIG